MRSTPGASRSRSAPAEAGAAGSRLACESSSGTSRRIGTTRSAGATAMRNIARQPQAGTTKYAVAAARKKPTGQPACRMPDAILRLRGGKLSIASAVPAVHSAPMPKPNSVRSTSTHANDGAK